MTMGLYEDAVKEKYSVDHSQTHFWREGCLGTLSQLSSKSLAEGLKSICIKFMDDTTLGRAARLWG